MTGAPEDLARLELRQETGFQARELTRLGFMHSSHGTTNQGCDLFLATGLEPGAPDREHEEQDMRQQWVTREAFEQMIGDAPSPTTRPWRPIPCCCCTRSATGAVGNVWASNLAEVHQCSGECVF